MEGKYYLAYFLYPGVLRSIVKIKRAYTRSTILGSAVVASIKLMLVEHCRTMVAIYTTG